MALAQHISTRLVDGRVIASTPLERRLVARVVLEVARQDALLTFGLADTHLHMLPACTREAAGQLARRVEISLVQRLGLEVGFVGAHFEAVNDGRHLSHAFTYVLEQSAHHGLDWDPLYEASNLPDLLGLRMFGAYTVTNVRQWLPRVAREDLLSCMGLAQLRPLDKSSAYTVEQALWATLATAGLANLQGRSRETAAAKHALVQVVGYRLPAQELAKLLGLTPRRVYKLRQLPADQRLLHAIYLQLGLLTQRVEVLARRELAFTTPRAEQTARIVHADAGKQIPARENAGTRTLVRGGAIARR